MIYIKKSYLKIAVTAASSGRFMLRSGSKKSECSWDREGHKEIEFMMTVTGDIILVSCSEF